MRLKLVEWLAIVLISFGIINEKFSILTKVISAKNEATYSALGAVPRDTNETLLLDLGGASTEIIHCKMHKIIDYKSFKIGAVNVSLIVFI